MKEIMCFLGNLDIITIKALDLLQTLHAVTNKIKGLYKCNFS